METPHTQHSRQQKMSIFLRRHEQWSAWIFFMLMSGLVMFCTGHAGYELLLAPLLGIMYLYALKICALYVRRSTALGVVGLFFAATPLYGLHPAELCMCLQVVVLYHVLVWARGKREAFRPRHFVVLGLAAGVTLLLLPAAVAFYIPLGALMLWGAPGRRLSSAGIVLGMLVMPLWLVFSGLWRASMLGDAVCYIPAVVISAVVVLLFLPSMVTLLRSRPERRHITPGALALAWALGVLQQAGAWYYYPLVLPALLGVALLLHKRVTNRRLRYLLRCIGLLAPFVTLCATLLICAHRGAVSQPEQDTYLMP